MNPSVVETEGPFLHPGGEPPSAPAWEWVVLPCPEAQADGVPCQAASTACDECPRAIRAVCAGFRRH